MTIYDKAKCKYCDVELPALELLFHSANKHNDIEAMYIIKQFEDKK